jgi:hypothetical protein
VCGCRAYSRPITLPSLVIHEAAVVLLPQTFQVLVVLLPRTLQDIVLLLPYTI